MSDWLNKYTKNSNGSQNNSQPTMQDAMNEVNKHPGMSYQQVFYQLCQERGINPNGPINQLMSLIGGKK